MADRPTIQFDDDLLRELLGGEIDGETRRYLAAHRRRYGETIATLERLRPVGGGPPPRLLDVGGFPGHMAFAARHLGWEVEVATEPLDGFPLYETFRRACDRHGIALRTLDVECDFFPYESDRFDAVLFAEVLEHLARNPFHTLGEVCRVLRPDGALILTTPNLASSSHLAALWRQEPILPPLSSPWCELFPTIATKRHFREYTASEIQWCLAGQNKDLYQFDRVELRFSDCWRQAEKFSGTAGWVGRLLRRLAPRWRGNVVATARKPPDLFLVRADEAILLDGWYDIEPQHPALNMPLETPYPVRWTSAHTEMSLPIPPAARERTAGARIRLTLPLRNPLHPDLISVRSVKMDVAGSSAGRWQPVGYSPDLSPISETFAVEPTTSDLHLTLSCETFCPDDYLKNGDRRTLGVQLIQSRIRMEIEEPVAELRTEK